MSTKYAAAFRCLCKRPRVLDITTSNALATSPPTRSPETSRRIHKQTSTAKLSTSSRIRSNDFNKETRENTNNGNKSSITSVPAGRVECPQVKDQHVITTRFYGKDRNKPAYVGDDVKYLPRDFVPGTILRLPPCSQRKYGHWTDVRLTPRYTRMKRGHPAIIVHNHENGLVNVVLCTTLNGRQPEGVVSEIKRPQSLLDIILQKFMPLDSGKRKSQDDNNKSQGNEESLLNADNTLYLDCGAYFPERTVLSPFLCYFTQDWAELTVYTMELNALTWLEETVVAEDGGLSNRWFKLADPRKLLSRIEATDQTLVAGYEIEFYTGPQSKLSVEQNNHFNEIVRKQEEEWKQEKPLPSPPKSIYPWPLQKNLITANRYIFSRAFLQDTRDRERWIVAMKKWRKKEKDMRWEEAMAERKRRKYLKNVKA